MSLEPCAPEPKGLDDDAAVNAAAHQLWSYDRETKAVECLAAFALREGGRCLTAGWPFVQGVVGVTPRGSTVAVVSNEATTSVHVGLRLEDGTVIEATAPPQSLQTFVLQNPDSPELFI